MSIEKETYDFIKAAIDAAPNADALKGAELHDTVYQTITKEFGVRIGDCESSLAPTPGGEAMGEFDGLITIVTFCLVAGPDTSQRNAAREKALDLAKAVSKLFLDDPMMGERVRDSRALRVSRGFDNIGSESYAVCGLQVIINETGQLTVQ